jgi:hypothetical protein
MLYCPDTFVSDLNPFEFFYSLWDISDQHPCQRSFVGAPASGDDQSPTARLVTYISRMQHVFAGFAHPI